MSGELKSVEKTLVQNKGGSWEPFLSKMTFFSFGAKNQASNFLTCSANEALAFIGGDI